MGWTNPPGVTQPAVNDSLWYDPGTPQPMGLAAQNTWLPSFFAGHLYRTGDAQPRPRLFDTPPHFTNAQDATHNRPSRLAGAAQVSAYARYSGYGEVL